MDRSQKPGNDRERMRQQSGRAALCGLMAALSVVLMLLGGYLAIATYAVPMFCSLFLLPALAEYGSGAAWLTYGAVTLLGLMLCQDKEAAFFYLFLGYYPILKQYLDKIGNKVIRLAAKLAVVNAAVVLMYAVLGFVLGMDDAVAEFRTMGTVMLWGYALLLNVTMLIFDRLLVKMSAVYQYKLRPRLGFRGR